MKRINLYFNLLLLLLSLGFTSCTKDEPEDEPVPPQEETEFEVSPTSVTFTAEGGSITIDVVSDLEWTISSNTDWLTFTPELASESAAITVTAEVNKETEDRTAILRVESGENEQEITVTQEAAEAPPAEDIEATIPPDETGIRSLSSVALANEMGVGWNLGNSLEAIGGETAWGNPAVTKRLIDSVRAAGFNAIRIPVAWSKFSNEETYEIRESWMNRIEEVVNYVLENDMYAIINIHWDGGWMQPTYDEEEYVNERLAAMWQQIAINFRDYGDHLLFAGTNEVMVEGDYGTPTEEYYTVQNGFNQTFVDAVRATGGRNHYRHLVVQGFNTNIGHTVNFAEIPEDVVDNRLMMEVHYYDPYNFTLNVDSEITQWGKDATDPELVEKWANEAYVDEQFTKMKINFIDKGVGVILGEYGAISRTDVEGHEEYLNYYVNYITEAAQANGIVPFYWDNGFAGNNGFALFERNTGEVLRPKLLEVIVQ